MATSYPGSLDNFTNPTSTSPINSPSHADQHSNANDAIEAIESELGTNPKGAKATVKARLDDVDTAIALKAPIASPTFTGTVTIPAGSAITGVPYLATANTFTGNNTFASPIVAFVGTSGSYSSAAVSGYNIIHLSQGMILINSQTGGDYNLATNAYYNSGWKYFESAGSTLINFGNGRFDFNTASSGTAGNAITYTSKMIIANSGTVTINGFGAGSQGLIVKGAASQTADLQQWQDSSGGYLSSIKPSGGLDLNAVSGTISGAGTNAIGDKINLFSSVFGFGIQAYRIVAYVDANSGFAVRKVAASGNRSSGTDSVVLYETGAGSFLLNSASTVGLTIKGAASQTANLQEWQNSAGTTVAFMRGDGLLSSYWGYHTYIQPQSGAGSFMHLTNNGIRIEGYTNITNTVFSIKGMSGQTGNLQEWHNSAGTVLTGVSPIGQSFFQNTTPITASAVSQAITAVSFTSTTATYTFSATVQTISVGEYVTVFGITPSGYNGTYQVTAVATVSAGSSYSFTVANTTNATVTVGTGYFFPSASVSISTQNKAHTGLIVKAVSGQTASTMEIQNSLGQPVTWWDSTGGMTASQAVVSTLYSGGFMNTGTLGYFNATTFSASVIPVVVRGAASQSADLQQWQDSAGTVLAYVAANGHLLTPRLNITNGGNIVDSAGTTPYFAFGSNQIAIYARNAAYKPLVIQGAASQSANLQEWQQSDGTVTSYVGGDGNIFVQNARALFVNSGYIGSASLVTKAAGPTWSGLIVKAATSQTANLQEWQDSSGNVLSKIDSFGAFKTASTASFGTISGGGVWGGYAPVVEIRNTSTSTSAINIFANGGPAIRVYDGSGYQRGAWNQDGSIVVGQNNTKLATLSVYADSAASVGTIIRGAASQTADLQQWQNSAGNSVAVISPGGNLDIALRLTAYNGVSAYNASTFGDPGILLPYTYSNVVGISTGFAGNVGLVIKGFTSQSGDLQQWRDSSGNILTGISSNGLIYSGKSYSSYNIESAGTLASSESIANTFNLQGKNNLIYPSIITDVGGNGWTSVTSNYGIAPDGTQTSTRYVWNSPGNCFATASDSNPNTYVGEIYTVSAYIKINAGTGSVALRYSKADSSKNAGIQINLSTKTATSVFDASDYNVLSYSLIPVGKNWYRAIATIKVLVNHTIERVMLAATNSVGDIEVWGFQLERGLSASPLTPTTNALVTTVNTLNIPYGQINLQSNASTIGLIIKSANAPTVNLTEWQTSTGAVVASIDPNGSAFFNSNFQINGVVAIGGGPQAYSQLIIQTNSATRNGLVIKAASSQTANIQEWQNNSGTVLANIDSTGRFLSTRPIRTDDVITSGSQTATLGQISAMSSGAGRIGLVVRGAVSQAVNLQEWQNNAGTILLSITPDGSIKGGNSNTISVNTASTVDTVALSSFTSMEYTLSIKQGSKIRSSKVLVHTDGTSVDSTEYGIMEMGGGITGILVTASVSGTDAILQVTITDAATTNATVKLIKTML